jgi:hypothetical protein
MSVHGHATNWLLPRARRGSQRDCGAAVLGAGRLASARSSLLTVIASQQSISTTGTQIPRTVATASAAQESAAPPPRDHSCSIPAPPQASLQSSSWAHVELQTAAPKHNPTPLQEQVQQSIVLCRNWSRQASAVRLGKSTLLRVGHFSKVHLPRLFVQFNIPTLSTETRRCPLGTNPHTGSPHSSRDPNRPSPKAA